MIIYFSFLLFLSIFTVIDFYHFRRQCIRYGLLLCCIFLVVIAGFRYQCGPDYHAYQKIFNDIVSNRNTILIEIGFIYTSKFLGIFGNYRLMLLCFAMVSITLKLIFFSKESEMPFVSVLLYFIGTFLAQDFGQIRQGLAISFSLFAFIEVYNRKFIKFLFFFLLAMFFHYTAIIIFPFYWIGRIKPTKFLTLFLIIASVLFSRYFLQLMDYLVPAVNIDYLNAQFLSYRDRSFGLEFSNFILLMITHIPIIFMYHLYSRTLLKSSKNQIFFQLFVLGTCMNIAFMPIPEIGLRGTAYFEILDTILLPNLVKIIKDDGRFVFCIFLTCLVLAKFYLTNADMPASFIPYQINFNLLRN
jgi:hypothetical protein